jgi:hypothetical protein
MGKFEPTAPPDDERLAALDSEHDGVAVLMGPEKAPFLYVIRRPTAHELSSYSAEVKRGKTLEANRLLLRAITVYPERAQVEQQIARWPASAGAALTSTTFEEFSGGVIDEHRK